MLKKKNNMEKENGLVSKSKTFLEELEKFVSAEVVVGKPIKCDNVTIIPLCDVSFGLGFGVNDSFDEGKQGGGVGGSITPNSLLVIEDGSARLINVKDSNSLPGMIPQILDRLNLDIIKKPNESNKKVKFEEDEE